MDFFAYSFKSCQASPRFAPDWMGNEVDGFLSSSRWSATGTHSGFGVYGPPTGSLVQIWGITQNQIEGGRIVKEWMLFNELDLMMQIVASSQV